MLFSLLEFAGVAVALLAVVPAFGAAKAFLMIRGLRYPAEPDIRSGTPQGTPEPLRGLFAVTHPLLEEKGFQLIHVVHLNGHVTWLDERQWFWIYYHQDEQTYAYLYFGIHVQTAGCADVTLQTFFNDGRRLSTGALQAARPTEKSRKFAPGLDLDELWMLHQQDLEQFAGVQREYLSPEDVERSMKTQRAEDLERLVTAGWATVDQEKQEWRFTVKGTWAMMLREFLGKKIGSKLVTERQVEEVKNRKKARKEGRETTLHQFTKAFQTLPAEKRGELLARHYRQHTALEQGAVLGTFSKLALLVVSVVLFCIAFKVQLDWQFTLLLLGVLFLHESGHLLAMRFFGYKNLQMLFLPFLGAVAIGKKNAVSAWKELIILFAGPLPGLCAGIVMATLIQEPGELTRQLINLLIILNLFNLLPFYPLDGGQIANILIFSRSHRLELAFQILSAACLTLVGIFLSRILAVIGFFMLAGHIKRANKLKLLSQVRREIREDPSMKDDDDKVLRRLFTGFTQPPLSKEQMVKVYPNIAEYVSRCRQQTAGFIATAFGISLFLSPLVVWALSYYPLQMQYQKQIRVLRQELRDQGLDKDFAKMPEPNLPPEQNSAPHLLAFHETIQDPKTLRHFNAFTQAVPRPTDADYMPALEPVTPPLTDVAQAHLHTPELQQLLRHARAAARQPGFWQRRQILPNNEETSITTPIWQVQELLTSSVVYHAEIGDYSTAYDDAANCLRLSRQLLQCPAAWQRDTGSEPASRGLHMLQLLTAKHPLPTPARLEELRAILDNISVARGYDLLVLRSLIYHEDNMFGEVSQLSLEERLEHSQNQGSERRDYINLGGYGADLLLPFNIAKYNHRPHLEYLQFIQMIQEQYRGRPGELLLAELGDEDDAYNLFAPAYTHTLRTSQNQLKDLAMQLRLGRAALRVYERQVGKASWPADPQELLANLPAEEFADPKKGYPLEIARDDNGKALILRYPPLTYEDVFGDIDDADFLSEELIDPDQDMAYYNTGRSWQLAQEPLQWLPPAQERREEPAPAPAPAPQSPASSIRAELMAEARRLKAAKAQLLAAKPDPATATPEEIQAFRQKARRLKADLAAFQKKKDAILQARREASP